MDKIKIGVSDYSREQIEKGETYFSIGSSTKDFLDLIKEYEDSGYTVKFKTNIWQMIFGLGKYKVIAYK